MAQATVKTVQFLDPRIEPQPDPVYDYVIAPTQNQYYKINASGLSDSSITFNNLTTLGADRAYLDTFEIELQVAITFETNKKAVPDRPAANVARNAIFPSIKDWTFDSFPFNKCVEQARVNVNGGAFFSEPLSYLRAKEHYMRQDKLSECYENVCPVHRPLTQTESGKLYNKNVTVAQQAELLNRQTSTGVNQCAVPTRLGYGNFAHIQSDQGFTGGYNNSIVRLGNGTMQGYQTTTEVGNKAAISFQNKTGADKRYTVYRVRWREPVFVSPFSSRYDATYGRPLYNITSLDFAFNLQNLGNMIRVINPDVAASVVDAAGADALWPDAGADPTLMCLGYTVHIEAAQLCYQVLTIPPIMTKPLTTLVPYRRFVPYITDYGSTDTLQDTTAVNVNGADIQIRSGVYTMNEIPTAIWVFCAPSKAHLQNNAMDFWRDANDPPTASVTTWGNWDSNKQFAFLQHISITLANTTQILNQAEPVDLYRIAKANGCDDSFWSWSRWDSAAPIPASSNRQAAAAAGVAEVYGHGHIGCGSVLRLKPGVDLIVPDQALIPGANANNMVIQVTGTFTIPPHSSANGHYSLWLLFEYVGVAAISAGQCEITMNPLGSGEVMAVSPVMSATSEETEGELEGSGVWDLIKRRARIAGQVASDGIISKLLKRLPGATGEKVGAWAAEHGMKRRRGESGGAVSGGAVMGRGLDDWI